MIDNQDIIRKCLLESEDGLTPAQLGKLIGKSKATVKLSLKRMADTYIDRWVDTSEHKNGTKRGGTKWSAVWMAVPIPENCPMPKKDHDGSDNNN